jgi:hypothetical protein
MVSSAMTYRTLLDKEGTTQTDAIIALRDDAEEPRFGYGGQLMLARQLVNGGRSASVSPTRGSVTKATMTYPI